MIQHVNDVVGPLTVGKMYWVPAVYVARYSIGRQLWWPVVGPVHTDKRFFNFDLEHQHVDFRFVGSTHFAQVGGRTIETRHGALMAWEFMASQPVTRYGRKKYEYTPHDRKMRCKRNTMRYPFSRTLEVGLLNDFYENDHIQPTSDGHIYCPHQRFRIDQVPPDANGMVTCPLHGLRINTTTGKCGTPVP